MKLNKHSLILSQSIFRPHESMFLKIKAYLKSDRDEISYSPRNHHFKEMSRILVKGQRSIIIVFREYLLSGKLQCENCYDQFVGYAIVLT